MLHILVPVLIILKRQVSGMFIFVITWCNCSSSSSLFNCANDVIFPLLSFTSTCHTASERASDECKDLASANYNRSMVVTGRRLQGLQDVRDRGSRRAVWPLPDSSLNLTWDLVLLTSCCISIQLK